MGNMALWFIGIMLGIIVVHLIHIKMYLKDIHHMYVCCKMDKERGPGACTDEHAGV